jgi:endonuclease-3
MQLSLFPDPILPLIRQGLTPLHGLLEGGERYQPTEQFFISFIGSRTRDEVAADAFTRLCARFPRWEMMLSAKPAAITTLLGDVQYAPIKAEHLLATLRRLHGQRRTLDLGFLADWPVGIAWRWLQNLPGVGPKVAAATLNFSSLRKPIFVVDTHILRLAKRLGLVSAKAGFAHAHRLLNDLIPNDWTERDHYQLHWLMKSHGQKVCRHRAPQCGDCPLRNLCPYFQDQARKSPT